MKSGFTMSQHWVTDGRPDEDVPKRICRARDKMIVLRERILCTSVRHERPSPIANRFVHYVVSKMASRNPYMKLALNAV